MAGETYEKRLYRLRDTVEEELDRTMSDLTNEISEAIGAVYDENQPDLSSDENYFTATGAREALWEFCKRIDLDPESVRPGWRD